MTTITAGAGDIGAGRSSPCSLRQLVIASGLEAGHLHVATHKKARGHTGGTPDGVMSKADDGRASFLLGGLKWGWHSESRRGYKSRQICLGSADLPIMAVVYVLSQHCHLFNSGSSRLTSSWWEEVSVSHNGSTSLP